MKIESITQDPENGFWTILVTDHGAKYFYGSYGIGLMYYNPRSFSWINLPHTKTHIHRENRLDRMVYQIVQQYQKYWDFIDAEHDGVSSMNHALDFWNSKNHGDDLYMNDVQLRSLR